MSVVLDVMIVPRISCIPSCSLGSKDVRNGVFEENHTALANWQWKNRCASSSNLLQLSQFLLILDDRLRLEIGNQCA
jgi:hypothetical protein